MLRSFPLGLRVHVRSIDRPGVIRKSDLTSDSTQRVIWLDEPYKGLRLWSIDVFDLVAESLHLMSLHVLTALQGQWEDDGWIERSYLLELAEIDPEDEDDTLNAALVELRSAGYSIAFQREAAGDFYRLDPQQRMSTTSHPTFHVQDDPKPDA